jgi:hypothetical protein
MVLILLGVLGICVGIVALILGPDPRDAERE